MDSQKKISAEMENANAIVLLRNRFEQLRGTQKQIAKFITGDLNSFIENNMNIRALAKNAGVAQSSVVRFYQSLGFEDYADFKISIAKNLKRQNDLENNLPDKKDNTAEILKKTAFISIQAINDSLDALDFSAVSRAIDLLDSANRIDFYGVGSSSMLVHDCYYRLMRIGYPCFFATDPAIMRTAANALDRKSVAFVISYSGRSRDPLRAMELAKQKGAKTICLTGFTDSPINQNADCSILCISNETKTRGEAYYNTVAQKVILDGIYNCLARKRATPKKADEMKKLIDETRVW